MKDSSSSSGPDESCAFDADKLDLKLSITLAGDRDAVDPVVRSVMEVVRELNCAPGREDHIELALTEALANAVIHGNRQDSTKKVHVSCRSTRNGSVDLIVRDEGPGFDPASVADPLSDSNLLSGHGRGVYLMKALMDEVRFAKGGKQVHMRKTRPVR